MLRCEELQSHLSTAVACRHVTECLPIKVIWEAGGPDARAWLCNGCWYARSSVAQGVSGRAARELLGDLASEQRGCKDRSCPGRCSASGGAMADNPVAAVRRTPAAAAPIGRKRGTYGVRTFWAIWRRGAGIVLVPESPWRWLTTRRFAWTTRRRFKSISRGSDNDKS